MPLPVLPRWARFLVQIFAELRAQAVFAETTGTSLVLARQHRACAELHVLAKVAVFVVLFVLAAFFRFQSRFLDTQGDQLLSGMHRA